jgi:asparagine N-glycosylation enzyme membrane subunit Stt3
MVDSSFAADGVPGMDAKASSRTSIFEYFLYSAIILETALAAFVYKVIFGGADMVSFNVALAIIYFGFLAWAIIQLNQLHRKRKLQEATKPEPPDIPLETVAVLETGQQERRILGLTGAQLVIVLIVFAAAVVSFSWALSILHPDK